MQPQSKNLIDYFLAWFDTIPPLHQQHIARLFILCTTDNSADFALTAEQALVRFRHYVTGGDFHLRQLSRLVVLRAIFDLILNNRRRFMAMEQELAAGAPDRKVAWFSEKQWEKTEASWRNFRNSTLTDKAIYKWLSSVT